VAGFYQYAVEEDLLDHSPATHVRRPRLDYESHATGLDRNELGALLVAAGLVDMVDGDPGSGFALVRPDGILAARGSAGDTHRVVDYLRRGLQVTGEAFDIPRAGHRISAGDAGGTS